MRSQRKPCRSQPMKLPTIKSHSVLGTDELSNIRQNERLLEKWLTDPSVSIHNYNDAIKFVQGLKLKASISSLDVIWYLTAPDNLGMQRLKQIFTLQNGIRSLRDNDVVNNLYVPIFMLICSTEAYYDQMACLALRQLTDLIWSILSVKERILNVTRKQELHDINAVVKFLLVFLITNRQSAQSDSNRKIIEDFVREFKKQRHPIAERISKELSKTGADTNDSLEDLISVYYQPGGRHDNDFCNITDIQIAPTCQEALLLKHHRNEVVFLPRVGDNSGYLYDSETAAICDRAFRLLREDMVSSVREQLDPNRSEDPIKFFCKGANHPNVNPRPQAEIFISVPGHIRSLKKDEEKRFWTKSKWLAEGSLYCLCQDGEPIMFCEIIQQNFRRVFKDGKARPKFLDSVYVTVTEKGNVNAIYNLRKNSRGHVFTLVAICTGYFSYKPILKALQSPSDCSLLACIASNSFSKPVEEPSKNIFSRKSALLIQNPKFVRQRPHTFITTIVDTILETKYKLLDDTQKKAFLDSVDFKNRVSLIQGPPGTGKTLVGVLVALALARIADVKILCVCYTNHQLDQFLDSVLEAGMTKIVRIGGRCQNQTLKPFIFKKLAESIDAELKEKKAYSFVPQSYWDLKAKIESIEAETKSLQKLVGARQLNWYNFRPYLSSDITNQFPSSLSGDGFVFINHNGKKIKNSADIFSYWRNGGNVPCLQDRSLWSLSHKERLSLVCQWECDIRDKLTNRITAKYQAISKFQEEKRSIRNMRYTSILGDAKIIGCTTTGAAIYRSLLSQAKCNILMIEEASEILEAHVLSILNDRFEKMVMIGDHKQLRPKINDYTLTVESGNGYDLDRSTFERLIISGHPYICLETQHRMRPEISTIVRDLCYSSLKDGDRVLHYPNIKGMQKDVVFVRHYHLEEQDKVVGTTSSKLIRSGSKVNKHEAELIVATAVYLRQQGYGPDDIVILTPYLGQLAEINRELSKKNIQVVLGDLDSEDLDSVFVNEKFDAAQVGPANGPKKAPKTLRVSTVDNFQGEQAPIILVSLVRSNLNDEIGFVKKIERINVLISRAQMGLIIFGNDQCLSGKCQIWTRVLSYFNCYDGVPVACSRHGTAAVICDPSDFQQLTPNGGCQRKCDFVLLCGHECSLQCHDERIITHPKCEVQVPELCLNLHQIWRRCSENSAPACEQRMLDICADGKHQFIRQCGLNRDRINCTICDNEKSLKKQIELIDSQNRKHVAKIIAERTPCLVGIDEEIAKSTKNSEIIQLRHRKMQAELEVKDELQNTVFQMSDQIRKCEEETAKSVLSEYQRCLDMINRKQRFKSDNDLDLKMDASSSAHTNMDIFPVEGGGDEDQQQLYKTKELRQHLESLSIDVSCNICSGDFSLLDGITCCSDKLLHDGFHFFCSSCFGHYVAASIPSDFTALSNCEFRIYCPQRENRNCSSFAFNDIDLVKFVSQAIFSQYLVAKATSRKNLLCDEFDLKLKDQLEIRIRTRNQILKTLTPKCPDCQVTFTMPDPCGSFICPQCKHNYCIFCREDCTPDLFGHTSKCINKHNPDVFSHTIVLASILFSWVQSQKLHLKSAAVREHSPAKNNREFSFPSSKSKPKWRRHCQRRKWKRKES